MTGLTQWSNQRVQPWTEWSGTPSLVRRRRERRARPRRSVSWLTTYVANISSTGPLRRAFRRPTSGNDYVGMNSPRVIGTDVTANDTGYSGVDSKQCLLNTQLALKDILNLDDSKSCSNVSCHAGGLPFPYPQVAVGNEKADQLKPNPVANKTFVICEDKTPGKQADLTGNVGGKAIKPECLTDVCKCLDKKITACKKDGFPKDLPKEGAEIALALCNKLRLYTDGANAKQLGCQ